MRSTFVLILFFVLASCNNKQETKTHARFFPIASVDTTLDYTFFQITVPKSWKMPNDDTLMIFNDATTRGRIQIGENEFIWYADGLAATDWSKFPLIVPVKDREMYTNNGLNTSYIIFSDDPKSVDSSRLQIHRVWYGQISGYKTKFFAPLKAGFGYTGLYIDSTSEIKTVAKLNFAMHADRLDSSTNAAFIKAMKTIKYRPSD
jgi:hypothetical protein